MSNANSKSRHEPIFRALAHPIRQAVVDFLFEHPGSSVGVVADQFDQSRISIMKHLRVLEEARLVLSRKQGRTRRLYFNPVPLHEIAESWRERYASAWSTSLLDLKNRVEGRQTETLASRQSPAPHSNRRGHSTEPTPEEPS